MIHAHHLPSNGKPCELCGLQGGVETLQLRVQRVEVDSLHLGRRFAELADRLSEIDSQHAEMAASTAKLFAASENRAEADALHVGRRVAALEDLLLRMTEGLDLRDDGRSDRVGRLEGRVSALERARNESPDRYDAMALLLAEPARLASSSGLTFAALRATNVARCEEVFHPVASWSPTDWGCAFVGEAGEAANKIKKLRRLDGADVYEHESAKQLVGEIAEEIADTIIYADLLAERLGIDLGAAVVKKFNQVSLECRASYFLRVGP